MRTIMLFVVACLVAGCWRHGPQQPATIDQVPAPTFAPAKEVADPAPIDPYRVDAVPEAEEPQRDDNGITPPALPIEVPRTPTPAAPVFVAPPVVVPVAPPPAAPTDDDIELRELKLVGLVLGIALVAIKIIHELLKS